jgi:hypothetical protein
VLKRYLATAVGVNTSALAARGNSVEMLERFTSRLMVGGMPKENSTATLLVNICKTLKDSVSAYPAEAEAPEV